MPRPVHFEVHADDPARAIAFYESVFAWRFLQWDGGQMEYWLIMTGGDDERGIDGGMVRRQGPRPADDAPVMGFPCTMAVHDLDATERAINEAGGVIVVPKMTIPGVGYLSYAKDTEGNVFGVMQADDDAG